VELERRPLALRNTAYAKQFADSVGLYPVSDGFELDTPEAIEERARASVHFNAHVRLELQHPGVTFGGRYDHSPIVVKDGSSAPVDQANHYEPSACPGADLLICGSMTIPLCTMHLVRSGHCFAQMDKAPDLSAWQQVCEALGLKLTCLHLPNQALRDLYLESLDFNTPGPNRGLERCADRAGGSHNPLQSTFRCRFLNQFLRP
jgi:hypothetical protein